MVLPNATYYLIESKHAIYTVTSKKKYIYIYIYIYIFGSGSEFK
jgi:hypothetical protein